MEQRALGSTTLKVSAVGLGCNNFGRLPVEASRLVVDRALEKGITFFDTADFYGNRGGSESQLGEILGSRRKSITLATKFGLPMDDSGQSSGASRRYIFDAVEASLKRLRTDWIDLYQLHVPDATTPMDETLQALTDLVQSGKVRYLGCSNLQPSDISQAKDISAKNQLAEFVTSQDEYSLLVRGAEDGLIPTLATHSMSLLPYYPLTGGLLTGKYNPSQAAPDGTRFAVMPNLVDRYMTQANLDKVARLQTYAKDQGRSLLSLAFGFLLGESRVASVIAGATKPEQIDANIEAANWQISPAQLDALRKITA